MDQELKKLNKYQKELEGEKVQLYYFESIKSRKAKEASVMMLSYSEIAYNHGRALQRQESWHGVFWGLYNQDDEPCFLYEFEHI